jgi:glutathione S-transferase
LPKGEHKKPEYLAINPVPALIDDGVIVHDSTIINEYLEDKFPEKPLLPRGPAMKARARAFEDYCDAYFAPSLGKILMQMRKPEGERDRIEEGEREVRQHFEYLDRELKGCEFFAGQFSLGDISFVPPFSNYQSAGFKVPEEFANLKAWWERLKSRESYAKSWPL